MNLKREENDFVAKWEYMLESELMLRDHPCQRAGVTQ